jgi:hypothetical protein
MLASYGAEKYRYGVEIYGNKCQVFPCRLSILMITLEVVKAAEMEMEMLKSKDASRPGQASIGLRCSFISRQGRRPSLNAVHKNK